MISVFTFLLFGSFTESEEGETASARVELTAQFKVVNDWGSEMTDIYIEHHNYLYGQTDKIIIDRLMDGEESDVFKMNFISSDDAKSDMWFIKFSADDQVWISKAKWHCKLSENDSSKEIEVVGLITLDGATSLFVIKPPASKLCDTFLDEI